MKFALTLDVRQHPWPTDYIHHAYTAYCRALGVVPVLVPNTLPDPITYVTGLGVQGVILSGGGDIAPDCYGQPNTASRRIAAERDQTEFALLRAALDQGWPVLGICRGMQVINVFFGGGLVQDLPTQLDGALDHEAEESHPIRLTESRVARLLDARQIQVNTHHHQGVTPDLLASALDVFAVSEQDSVIEGVLHPAHPILGVQWHPERPSPSRDSDLRLFDSFLKGTVWA